MKEPVAGTQPERTALAENRTSASALVVGIALLRVGVVAESGLASVIALVAIATCLVGLVLSWVDYVDHQQRKHRRRLGLPRPATASAISVSLVSAAGLAVALI